MHDHSTDKKVDSGVSSMVLVGNPNVGKSVLFGLLTGKYVDVSNYPGTTVEVSHGTIAVKGRELTLIDSPGVNSLNPMSEDERVTRDIILSKKHAGIIQVVDSKNLRRGLLITLQLIELGIPMVLVLNLYDEAMERGIEIDAGKLSHLLGIDVIKTVAVERRGLPDLREALTRLRVGTYKLRFNEKIEKTRQELTSLIRDRHCSKEGLALLLIAESEANRTLGKEIIPTEDEERAGRFITELRTKFRHPLGFEIQRKKQEIAEEIYSQTVRQEKKEIGYIRNKLGELSMHPVWGVPILAAVLYVMYKFVGEFGAGVAVDFMESVLFGEYINPSIIALTGKFLPVPFLREMLVGEYGIFTMGITYSISIVLPIVSFFFIFFGLLEDAGYLARLTVMSDRIFKKIGMNGRAVLPMVLGLGCDTMATLTVRILDTRKERIIATLLLALGVPCSAQLGVVMGMLGGISMTALIVVFSTVLLQMLIVGMLAARVLPGDRADFLIEIPPFRLPKIKNIFIKTYFRVKWFLKEAVPLFVLGTMVLFIFEKIGLLTLIERGARPIITGVLGLPVEATAPYIIGFLRRDYGAAGLFKLAKEGMLNMNQLTVGIAVMVLFIPCLANLFVIIKEQGSKRAALMTVFIFSYAILVGGVLNQILRVFPI